MSDQRTGFEPDLRALFSDTTEEYLIPAQPDLHDKVTIRLRTGKDEVEVCFLVVYGSHLRMHLSESDELFDYYSVRLEVSESPLRYYFMFIAGGKKYRYTRRGIRNTIRPGDWWHVVPGFHPPEWAAGAVMYQIFVDRFSNGDPTNDNTDNTVEKAAPNEWFGRHGGDLKGIIDHLDAIKALGATAVWSTPLLLDNEPTQSYHGYACADYYHIDPRYGSNELYRTFVNTAHNKGLKVIMDIVPNHCGSAHWWMNDLPYHDWIHQYPTFTRSNWQFSTAADPHASEADFLGMNSGWFDTSMPDMNLDNPDVLKYFQQWAIWWIEAMDIDGLRVDTYPYNEKVPISEWTKAVRNEYPGINIVGECWTRPTSQVAYWQADARNPDGYNSNLPCVMDFPLQEAMCAALSNNGEGWGNGLLKCYEVVAEDFLYAHPDNLLIFDSNHDTPRVRDMLLDKSFERNKLIVALLATMRGIPQLTYGEEYGLVSLNPEDINNHGALRVNHPWFDGTPNGLTKEQEDLYAYYAKLLNWRRTNKTIHEGKLMHFLSRDNTYAYVRYTDKEAVLVYLNAGSEPRQMPVAQYHEVLMNYSKQGTDIVSGKSIDLNQRITVEPLTAMILPLNKQ